MNRWRRCNEKQKPVKVAPPLQNWIYLTFGKKKIMLQQTTQQNKGSKIYFTRHVQKKINNVEYYVTSYKGIEQR